SRIEVVDRIGIEGNGLVSFKLNEAVTRPRASIGGRAIELVESGGGWRLAEPLPPDAVLTLDYDFLAAEAPAPNGPFLGPRGGFLPGWSKWLAEFDGQRSSVSLTIESPLPLVAVATGELVEESREEGIYRARSRSAPAGDIPSVFAGPYLVDERVAEGVRYRTYFTRDTRELAPLYLDRSAQYVTRFEEQIGDYPYAGFSVVAAPVPVGLGFAGLTYVSERILPLPFMQTRSLAHEVLHSWFGSAVEVDYGSGNWVEGLTTYLADYGILDDPAAERRMRLGWLRDYNALPPERDIVLKDFVAKTHDADQIVGYDKVAFVFHMLRRRLGDHAFRVGLRRFYAHHRGTRASWDDLRSVFERVSEQDLERFFSQWLERPGAPRLVIESVEAMELENQFEVRLALAQSEPVYDLLVPVEVQTSGGTERVEVPLDAWRSDVLIQTEGRPRRVSVDPEFDVFRRLAPGEAPPILRDVLLEPATRTVVLSDDERAGFAAKALAEALLGRPVEVAPNIGEAPGDRPLLLIGTGAAIDQALARLEIARPNEADGEGTASVWTVPGDGTSPVLVVRGDDARALEALEGPLPHYRRDSWLRFEGDTAIDRGIWSSGRSALSVDLDRDRETPAGDGR
ncbi:MAG: M1 family aminopeptidase, partial [Geminicoccaceae bacterium]|nr:M1 family aminopeptidase [Geminicoccaceae bacterium]